jgi:VCBS repeat-containing protein
LNASGGFSYTPANNFVGTDSFGYKASDGIITSPVATVTVTITNIPAPNRAPIAVTDQFGTEKNTPLNVSAPGVLANDSDPDTNSITAVIAAFPAHGQLNLSSSGGFTYTPATDFVGTDSFTYRAFDGITTSAIATVTIKVTNGIPVITNRAPVANAEQYSIASNSRLDVPAISGVLSNDYDPDGNPIVAVLSAAPLHGELTLDATGSFSYTPASDFSGIDVFSYRASDGTLLSTITTVTITVTNAGSNPPANLAPVAAGEQYGTTKDTLLTVSAAQGVLVNDFDPDGNSIEPVLVSLPAHGAITMYANGGFLYMPNNGFIGTDSFAYRASDGIGVSAVASVIIAVSNSVTVATNRTPVASGEIYTTQKNRAFFMDAAHGVLANDYDPDGDAVTAAVVSPPAQGTVVLATNGSFVFTPGADFVGNDSFAYRVSDGKAFSSVVTVIVTVTDSAPASEITCADCLVELNSLLAAQDIIGSISIQSVPITSSNSLDEAVRAYAGVAKSLRARDPVVVEQLSSVGNCLLVVLSNDVVARRGIVASMYPSPWSASANKLVTLLEQVSRDPNSQANAVRVLTPALKNLKRIDTFIARSLVVPESLEDRTISFSLTAATGGKFSVEFKNGNFIAEFADGSLKGGSYSFAQTAWDQGNLNLYFTSAPPELLQLQFRIPRGRVKGPLAKGSFMFVR